MVSGPRPPAPPRPRVWTVFIAFFTMFFVVGVAQMIAIIVIVAVRASSGAKLALSPEGLEALMKDPAVLLASLLSTSIIVLAAAVAAAALSPTPLVERLRLGPPRGDRRRWALGPAAVVAVVGVGGALDSAFAICGWESASVALLDELARQTNVVVMLGAGALLGPVAEELFFRGYAQTRLVARWGPAAGVVVASALFGLLHMEPVHVVLAFAIGLVLGWTTERCGSIRPAIVAHVCNNAAAFGLAVAGQLPDTWLVVAGHAVAGVAGVGAVAWLTRR